MAYDSTVYNTDPLLMHQISGILFRTDLELPVYCALDSPINTHDDQSPIESPIESNGDRGSTDLN